MRLFQENPRTGNFSKIKFFFINLEKLFRNSIYSMLIFATFFKSCKNFRFLDLGSYKDTRFINYLFYSIKKNFLFSYDLDYKIFSLIKKIGPINFFLYCVPNFRIKNKNLKLKFVLNDKNNKTINSVYFNDDYFSNLDSQKNKNTIIMPYYLYPRIYNHKYNSLKKLRNENKIFKIIFSGSTHELLYRQFKWKHHDKSRMLNRNEILNFVTKEFSTEIFYIESAKDFKDAEKSGKKIILSLNDKLLKKTSSKLSNFDHLKFVAQSNFFITAPGTGMPLCHHLVESIKFGTIPITSYADWLYPSLNDSLCLKFKTFSELYSAIEKAIFMKNEEVLAKKNNLLNFYNTNLSPGSFRKKLFTVNFKKEVIVCNDHDSAALFLKKNNI